MRFFIADASPGTISLPSRLAKKMTVNVNRWIKSNSETIVRTVSLGNRPADGSCVVVGRDDGGWLAMVVLNPARKPTPIFRAACKVRIINI
jgi:hypothetical protein